MKTIEEMHTMTIDELRDYGNDLFDHYMLSKKIRDYRIVTNDDNNPFLLTINNCVVCSEVISTDIQYCTDCATSEEE